MGSDPRTLRRAEGARIARSVTDGFRRWRRARGRRTRGAAYAFRPWHAGPANAPRIGFYHVYARGTGRPRATSRTKPTTRRSTTCTAEIVDRHGWSIHAHCLMQTHHHVLVEAPHEALVRGMHLLGTCRRCASIGGATASATRPPAGSGRARSHTHGRGRARRGLHRDESGRCGARRRSERVPMDVASGDARPRARPGVARCRLAAAAVSRRSDRDGVDAIRRTTSTGRRAALVAARPAS